MSEFWSRQFYRKQQIDELIESSHRRPAQGRMKVMILKDAQQDERFFGQRLFNDP